MDGISKLPWAGAPLADHDGIFMNACANQGKVQRAVDKTNDKKLEFKAGCLL